ncbi:MAG: hypothetical protein HOH29_08100 [Cellvibrionales bacterium]|nr:hypothetical protein [Cellvibrionales bacterium]
MTVDSKEFLSVWSYRIQAITSAVLQLAIAVLVIILLLKGVWISAFAGAMIFALTFVPAFFERQLSVHLPIEFTLLTTVFLYASFALGEVRDFYTRFWWWDLMLHSLSSLTIGIMAFLAIYVFHMTRRVQMTPIYIASMTFCLTVTMGTLWELFEFSLDWFFQFTMQKSGLIDTMTDLMVDVIGAFIAAILGYLYVRNGDSLIVDRLIHYFVAKNPKLFN